ncbi:hypothetical protein [Microtetraspora sp. NBRC 13810]|nr:hypothetical protein [Microtetraspora sp. NBRC 13810]
MREIHAPLAYADPEEILAQVPDLILADWIARTGGGCWASA